MGIALAIEAQGVRIGRIDTSIEDPRKLLPAKRIVAVSCSIHARRPKGRLSGGILRRGRSGLCHPHQAGDRPVAQHKSLGNILVVLEDTDASSAAIGTSRQI